MAKSIKNAVGKTLYYSETSNSWIAAAAVDLKYISGSAYYYGTEKNDSIWAAKDLKGTILGGGGDDIYYLSSPDQFIWEAAGKGTDTVQTWFSYQLNNSNIENLKVMLDGTFGFGNSLDNIIEGGAGSQTLWGAGGNDILTGGAGADTFIIDGGGTRDTITDFSADDTIRLAYYTFKSFNDVLKNSTQVGNDVFIKVNDTSSVTLLNTKLSSLKADQFDLNLSWSKLKLSFNEDFSKLSLNTGKNGGTWDTKWWWSDDKGSTLGSNDELQWYVNPSYGPTSSIKPFSIDNGILTINAQKTPDNMLKTVGYEYTSGMLTTHSSFAQTYGYFEMRADLPEDKGAWPAFWLMPKNGSWPPEIDVMEAIGGKNSYYGTVHSAADGGHTKVSNLIHTQSTQGFHNYGLLWTKDEISWYFDGTKVASTKTPADMHSDMYLIVNQAVGGWAGTPSDSDFADGSQFKIDYIKAYTIPADGILV